jgi:imidazoleglycerol-phosphate dehydratase
MTAVRQAVIDRQTRETTIHLVLTLDGQGRAEVRTGVGFLDHLLTAFARHGVFDLVVQATGDLEIDEHHTVEDVAIALGRALNVALGERRGIVRIAHAYAPLDEALARVVVDLSGRGYAVVETGLEGQRLGQMDGDLVRHFLETLALEGRLTLHAQVLAGRNAHHRAEALFKALARALDQACRIDPRIADQVPSTKGVLDRGLAPSS